MGIQYGYIRVSTKEQNIDRQWNALKRYGILEENLYIDKRSGKDFDRPQYIELLKVIQQGDCLFVTSLDRLGRNYSEIQHQWYIITKIRCADIVVLDMALLDTRQTHENLMGLFIADMVLQILCYVAETERDGIRKRQAEGIAAAQDKGVQFGRTPIPIEEDFYEVVKVWRCGKISAREAARRLNVSHSWLYRKAKELNI